MGLAGCARRRGFLTSLIEDSYYLIAVGFEGGLLNPLATFGSCLFAASLGMFTFPIVAIFMSFYIPSPFASIFLLSLRLHTLLPYRRTLLLHCCSPSSCHVCPLGIHIQEPFSSAFLLYCHVSLHSPEFYISLMLSTCRSQPSTIPSIRPWASESWSKVLFLLVFSIPAHMTWLSLAVSLCARYTSLNPRRLAARPLPSSTMTSRPPKGGETAHQVVPSCCLRHHNQSKGRILCAVSLESS